MASVSLSFLPIVFQKELDFINKIFNEVIEVKNLQNNINEE
jgi:hypothetical protein